MGRLFKGTPVDAGRLPPDGVTWLNTAAFKPTYWGAPGQLLRYPRNLVIIGSRIDSSDIVTDEWIESIKPAFDEIKVAVYRGTAGRFPILDQVFYGGIETVSRNGTFKNPIMVPSARPDIDNFLGGKQFVATVTRYRVTFLPGAPNDGIPDSEGNNLLDYVYPSTNGSDPPFSGYDQYFNINEPMTPFFVGWTAFSADAQQHLEIATEVAAKYDKFHHRFYQGAEEISPPGVYPNPSSVIPDGVIDAMAPAPYFSRASYSPANAAAVRDRIVSDALAFFA